MHIVCIFWYNQVVKQYTTCCFVSTIFRTCLNQICTLSCGFSVCIFIRSLMLQFFFTLKYHAWKAFFISMCNLFLTNKRCYLYVHAIIFYIKKTAAYFRNYIILVLKVQQSRVYFILKDDQSGKARIFTNIVNVIV